MAIVLIIGTPMVLMAAAANSATRAADLAAPSAATATAVMSAVGATATRVSASAAIATAVGQLPTAPVDTSTSIPTSAATVAAATVPVNQATTAVIAALEAAAADPAPTTGQREVVRKAVGYHRRNLPFMRYDEYLARGWPIGTGVVEGACGHLVKDRTEQAGMRWTKPGAQAVLDPRAVRLTGAWGAYWQFQRQEQHRRLYGPATRVPASPEAQLLAPAA